MEFEVKVLLNHKVYRPTVDQFYDMKTLLHEIVNDKQNIDVGICVIKPPLKVKPIDKRSTFTLKKCVTQDVDRLAINKVYRFNFDSIAKMTMEQFLKASEQFEQQTEIDKSLPIEDQFWENVLTRSSVDIAKPIYGLDNVKSLYPDDFEPWNLNAIQSNISIIHGKAIIPGVNTPYWNMGMLFTSFGLHLEDSNLASINTLLDGAERIWYAIPERFGEKLAKFIQSMAPEKDKCDLIVRHKDILVAPSELVKAGIPFAKVIQEEGDIILTMFGAYHQGFNCGVNRSESVNIATPEWLPHFRLTQLCSCDYADEPRILHGMLEQIVSEYEQTINEAIGKLQKKREKRPDATSRNDKYDHWAAHDGKVSRSTCKMEGCRQLTNIFCTKCKIHLCFTKGRNCFLEFHNPH